MGKLMLFFKKPLVSKAWCCFTQGAIFGEATVGTERPSSKEGRTMGHPLASLGLVGFARWSPPWPWPFHGQIWAFGHGIVGLESLLFFLLIGEDREVM